MFFEVAIFFLLVLIFFLLYIIWSKHKIEENLISETQELRRLSYRNTVELQQLQDSRLFDSQISQFSSGGLRRSHQNENFNFYENSQSINYDIPTPSLRNSQLVGNSGFVNPNLNQSYIEGSTFGSTLNSTFTAKHSALQDTLNKPRPYIEIMNDMKETVRLKSRFRNAGGQHSGNHEVNGNNGDMPGFMRERYSNFNHGR